MKKNYAFLLFLSILLVFIIFSCSDSEENYGPVSPVTVDLALVPYQKLSDYKFFEGEMKNQIPSLDVLPFEPASALFTDYALKKRFVWMPKGTKATYNGDGKVLDFPVGAALIKTFYYNNVQNVTPVGATRIIETRVMIRKATGWIFANYVWNAEQTEALYDMAGSFTQVSWIDENDVTKSANYRIPSSEQCIVCHKSQQTIDNILVTTHIPIGLKPQNLNYSYNYGTTVKNQLAKWIEVGYLDGNFTFPTEDNTVVNYMDASKPIGQRARAYVDANCSHCHMTDRHCDYRPMRFAYSETANNEANMGVCVNTQDMQGFSPQLGKIVTPGRPNQSMMYHRLNTTNPTYRMPLHGRTIIHTEGLAVIEQWINSLQECE